MIPRSFDDIRQFQVEALRARQGSTESAGVNPSPMWEAGSHAFDYVPHLPDWELENVRRHTDHVTGDTYIRYHYFSESARSKILRDYLLLAKALGCTPTEGPRGIGFDFGGSDDPGDHDARMQGGALAAAGLPGPVRVSHDLIRYMQVCHDLQEAGALDRGASGALLEIGGGYGGLAAVVRQYAPALTYVIVDLEETQFLQAAHLSARFGFDRIRLHAEGLPRGELDAGCFHLVPQHAAESVEAHSFAIAVNQQSMQEMTNIQVERYCRIMSRCAKRFYSCNLDRHPQRISTTLGLVTDLTSLLVRHFGAPTWKPPQRTRLPRFLRSLRSRESRRADRIGDSPLPRAVYDCQRAATSSGGGSHSPRPQA